MSKTDAWGSHIHPLDMNGLAGRMVLLPAPAGKSAETLFLYGQHSSLEHWRPLLEYLNRFGAVTAPDLPGFGGMDSFFSIGKLPTINTYADYLAAFFKFRFRRKQVNVVAVGFGFVIFTRMLQRYPALGRHVKLVVSVGGYTRYDDILPANRRRHLWRMAYLMGSGWLPARLVRYGYLNPWTLPRIVANDAAVLALSDVDARMDAAERAIALWRQNDLRTRFYTSAELLRFDNCARSLSLPLWHVHLASMRDRHALEQRLRVVYDDSLALEVPLSTSDLLCIDSKMAAKLIGPKLRRQLAKA